MNIRFLSSLLLASSASAHDILDIAEGPDFNTLLTALQLTGLDDVFDVDVPWTCSYHFLQWLCPKFTVFAPTNDAFTALPDQVLSRLVGDEKFRPHLLDLLYYHTAHGKILSSDIDIVGVEVVTLNEETLLAQKESDIVFTINSDTNIVTPDVGAINGVVHSIDKVLSPASTANIAELATAAGLTTLVSLLTSDGIDLGSFVSDNILTVFAPTNEAFTALIQGGFDISDVSAVADLLKYHVIENEVFTSDALAHERAIATKEGSLLFVNTEEEITLNNGVSITQANILASNGVIHIIDTVLTPPGDIATIASGDSNFSTLVAAIVKADLLTTIQGAGPFTVFAPTNSAFTQAGIVLENYSAAELAPILLYHVIPGVVTRDALDHGAEITTAQDSTISVTWVCTRYFLWWCIHYEPRLNGSVQITQADIPASNGIIHVIDTVLIPQ